MKKIIPHLLSTIFMLGLSTQVQATNYYISQSGNNANDGLTNATAWQTMNKASGSKFLPGDRILFKRGDTFRGGAASIWGGFIEPRSSGTESKRITIGAYGTGAKPILLGSVDKSATSAWTNITGNIWYTQMRYHVDIGNLIFGTSNYTAGSKRFSRAELTKQGDYYFNTENDRVEIYSTTNPGSFYTHIEAARATRMITAFYVDYLTIENLDIRNTSYTGIMMQDANHIIVRSNALSWIGGGNPLPMNPPKVRLGNGIVIWSNVDDCLVINNIMTDIYDTGITNQQNSAPSNHSNLVFRNNIVSKAHYGMEFFSSNPNATMTNITYDHNTFVDIGHSWGENQRSPVSAIGNASAIQIYRLGAATTRNVKITNNIIANSTNQLLRKRNGETWGVWHDHIQMSGNCWYQPNDTDIGWKIVERKSEYTINDFEMYKNTEGKDLIGSIIANPHLDSNYMPSGACHGYGAYGTIDHTKETDPTQEVIRADVDQNSNIIRADAMLVLRNSVGLTMNGTNWQDSETTGDVNCDGDSMSVDAMLILRYARKLNMNGTRWCENK